MTSRYVCIILYIDLLSVIQQQNTLGSMSQAVKPKMKNHSLLLWKNDYMQASCLQYILGVHTP